MLCSYCSFIDFAQARPFRTIGNWRLEGYRHHANVPDLMQSARGGCELCSLIAKEFTIQHVANEAKRIAENTARMSARRIREAICHTKKKLGEEVEPWSPYAFELYEKEIAGGQVWFLYPRDHHEHGLFSARPLKFIEPNFVVYGSQLDYVRGGRKAMFSVPVRIFAQYDSSKAIHDVIPGRPIYISPKSEGCLEFMRGALSTCLNTHFCSTALKGTLRLPTRIIDIGSLEKPALSSILITKGQPGQYVALSHCWGATPTLTATTTNIQTLSQNLPHSDLPQTIQDAIDITRNLGYRYLWVDSLCILQDSHWDWVLESSQMQDYYKNALVTIAASSAPSDISGFLDQSRPEPQECIEVPFHSDLSRSNTIDEKKSAQTTEMVYISTPTPSSFRTCPLNARGWTLQGDLLSPIVLYFTDVQLEFRCREIHLLESDPLKNVKLSDISQNIESDNWYAIVSELYNRNFTKSEDTFPAIGGVAREFATAIHGSDNGFTRGIIFTRKT